MDKPKMNKEQLAYLKHAKKLLGGYPLVDKNGEEQHVLDIFSTVPGAQPSEHEGAEHYLAKVSLWGKVTAYQEGDWKTPYFMEANLRCSNHHAMVLGYSPEKVALVKAISLAFPKG